MQSLILQFRRKNVIWKLICFLSPSEQQADASLSELFDQVRPRDEAESAVYG